MLLLTDMNKYSPVCVQMCSSYKGLAFWIPLLQNEKCGQQACQRDPRSVQDPAVTIRSPSQFTILSFFRDSLSGTNEQSALTSQVRSSAGGFIGPRGTVRAPLSSGSH